MNNETHIKLEMTSGEARVVVLDQVGAVANMLTELRPLIESGQADIAYKRCNFDLIKRMAANLETWADSSA